MRTATVLLVYALTSVAIDAPLAATEAVDDRLVEIEDTREG